MQVIRLLALDLAGRTGYAMRLRDGSVKVGVARLDHRIMGKRNPLPMVRLYHRLELLGQKFRIRSVLFEETFARGSAKYRLDSLQHAVVLWAVMNRIRWQRVSVSAWKKAMLGDPRATKHDYTVAALERFKDCRMWTDDHCAARWLLEYGLERS